MSSTKLKTKHTFSRLIFASRWLQLPIYLGLIAVQAAYAWKFLVSLFELLRDVNHLSETHFMLSVLGLIDVVMIANLLVMVTIGGYETFVSRLNIDHHPDQPEWLDHVNASVLKVKLSMALISISSIHLLKTFISAANLSTHEIMWQLLIHCAFLFSAAGIAFTDKLLMSTHAKASTH